MRSTDHGSNLVEFALVLPLLLILLGGVIDFGRAFHDFIVITNAAREGARQGARLPCYGADPAQRRAYKSAIVAATASEAEGSGIALTPDNIIITPDPVVAARCPGRDQPISVQVNYAFHPSLTGLALAGDITLTRSARMMAFGNDQQK